jgi:hypothetical protein
MDELVAAVEYFLGVHKDASGRSCMCAFCLRFRKALANMRVDREFVPMDQETADRMNKDNPFPKPGANPYPIPGEL